MSNYCREISIASKEQLFATSPTVNYWILVEYNSEWKENVLKSIGLSDAIKQKLSDMLHFGKFTRLQWIKNDYRANEDLVVFYLIESTRENRNIYRVELHGYEEILNLNTSDILNPKNRSEKPILLVCTHKNYDQCCGRMGYTLYKDIQDDDYFDLWQTTHLGGHRFAANVVILPAGIYYGRVDNSSFYVLKDKYLKNQIALEILRGRAYYDKYTQAAEYYLRRSTGELEMDSHEFQSVNKFDTDSYVVTFSSKRSNKLLEVHIQEIENAIDICPGCNDRKPKAVSQFRLLDIIKSNG